MGFFDWILRDDIGAGFAVKTSYQISYWFPCRSLSGRYMFPLATRRLLLRHLHILDSESLYRVFGAAEVMRFGDGVQTREWVGSWLQTCFDWYYKSWGFGPYAVVTKKDKEVIGYCGLFYFPDLDGQQEIEIGYRLARSVWGQGYATEAAVAVRDYAFKTLGMKRLIAMIDPSNIASIRVATKIGMQYEKDIMLEGYARPNHVYSMSSD